MKQIFDGIIIGMGAVIPGVSGSVLAMLLGVYEHVLFIFNDYKRNIKQNFFYLLKILIGILLGMAIFGNIILLLLPKYSTLIYFIFIGLILGGIPELMIELKSKKEKINILFFSISIFFSFIMFIINKFLNLQSYSYSDGIIKILFLMIGGFLFVSGKIIPGISSSAFMIMLGIYDKVLLFMSNPFTCSIYEYIEFIPFIIGCLFGIIILFNFINKCLSKYFCNTYSCVIGFIIGSIFSIIPISKIDFEYFASIIVCIIMYKITLFLTKYVKKIK